MKIFNCKKSLVLESGEILEGFHLAYETYGQLNENRSNVKWVFHALTANASVHEWWSGILGSGLLLDPEKDYIICVNIPGSCYGSSYALDIPTGKVQPYYYDFPLITIKDMVYMYDLLRQYLLIDEIALAIGGSMGGMQAMEYAIHFAHVVKELVVIACGAKLSPWAKAFNASQRMAIEADNTWGSKRDDAGIRGLKAARAMAMISYRNNEIFNQAQADVNSKIKDFRVESYLYYQGEKLTIRFDAFAYYALTRSMDSHDVGRGDKDIISALQKIKANTLVVSIKSDILFPLEEQLFLSKHIPKASFAIIESNYGHDGFLIDSQQLNDKYFTFKNQKQTA